MKNVIEQAENIICELDKSQDELEEMAFELLNAVDHVRKHNSEMHQLLELILETESEEVTESAIRGLAATVGKVSKAMNNLENFVHRNEEACSEQRKNVEEAKQVLDFLRCAFDWD